MHYLLPRLFGSIKSATLASKELILMIDLKKFDCCEKDSLVIFVNPSTPDGKYYDLKSLFSMWIKQNATVVIDEFFGILWWTKCDRVSFGV